MRQCWNLLLISLLVIVSSAQTQRCPVPVDSYEVPPQSVTTVQVNPSKDVTCDGGSMNITAPPKDGNGMATLSGTSVTYTAPATSVSGTVRVRLACGAITCDKIIVFMVTSEATFQPSPTLSPGVIPITNAPPSGPGSPPIIIVPGPGETTKETTTTTTTTTTAPTTTATPVTTTAAPPTPAPTLPICSPATQSITQTVGSSVATPIVDSLFLNASLSCVAVLAPAPAPQGTAVISRSGDTVVYFASGIYTETIPIQVVCAGVPTCIKQLIFAVVPTTTAVPPTPTPTVATSAPVPQTLLCPTISIVGTTRTISTGAIGPLTGFNFTSGLTTTTTCDSMGFVGSEFNGIAPYQLSIMNGQYTLNGLDLANGVAKGDMYCAGQQFCRVAILISIVAPTQAPPIPNTTQTPSTAAPNTSAPAAPTTTAAPPVVTQSPGAANGLPQCTATFISATLGRVLQGPLGEIRYLDPFSGRVVNLATPCSYVALEVTSSTYGNQTGSELFLQSNSNYTFFPSTLGTGNIYTNLWCNYRPLCTKAFFISVNPVQAPTDAPTAAPTVTNSPPTPPPTWRQCVSTAINVFAGAAWSDTLTKSITDNCALLTFALSPNVTSVGLFQVNSRGDANYQAPSTNFFEQVSVDVSCLGKPLCQLTVFFQTSIQITSVPTPAPSTVKPIQECPKYYYTSNQGVVASNSLRGQLGQPPCSGVRSFSLRDDARDGVLVLQANGDFTYDPPGIEDVDDFGYNMYCDGDLTCVGRAYIMVSNVTNPNAPGQGTNAPFERQTSVPVTYVASMYQSCSGSCLNPWLVDPLQPALWDDTPGVQAARKDGRSNTGVDVYWLGGALVISTYSKIGSLAQRFPTFERLDARNNSLFTVKDIMAVANPTSTAFDSQCLANQPTDVGLGAEVWSITNAGQGIGPRYRRGKSWYQKFGGVHDRCDTFVNSCQYAPLLTPRSIQSSDKGIWSVKIDDCDVTWTGVFPFAALLSQRRVDGTKVWNLDANRRMSATLYSEAVKPTSWVSINAGVSSEVKQYQLSVTVQQWVSSRKVDVATVQEAPFTIDPQLFEYTTAEGDRAFGINMLVYAVPKSGEPVRFLADRRVKGWRVTQATFNTPDDSQCPTCTGKGNKCFIDSSVNDDSNFLTDNIQQLYCEKGTSPRLVLSKGPITTVDDCAVGDSTDRSKVYGQRGFSPSEGCNVNFQNLTLRGIAVGSGLDKTRPFSYEGTIGLQLLMTNGNRVAVNVDLSLFVSMLSVGNGYSGAVDLCRASPYWPVLDPLGTSLPDDRFYLSPPVPQDTDVFLCLDQTDKTFGPEGWAVVGFKLDGYDRSNMRVEEVGLRYPGSVDVFFIFNDPTTGAPRPVPSSIGTFWKDTHPFFNFRDVTYRVANGTVTSPSGTTMSDVDFAFALNPGVIAVEADIEVFCVFNVLAADGTVLGRPTLRQRIHVDPLLTAESRYGPAVVRTDLVTETNNDSGAFLFFVIAGLVIGVLALGVVVLARDTDRPLPRWMPKPDTLGSVISQPLKIIGVRRKANPSPTSPAVTPTSTSPSTKN